MVTSNTMSGEKDDHVSPYLRRPLRSLMDYLREVAQRSRQQGGQLERPVEESRSNQSTSGEADGSSKKDN